MCKHWRVFLCAYWTYMRNVSLNSQAARNVKFTFLLVPTLFYYLQGEIINTHKYNKTCLHNMLFFKRKKITYPLYCQIFKSSLFLAFPQSSRTSAGKAPVSSANTCAARSLSPRERDDTRFLQLQLDEEGERGLNDRCQLPSLSFLWTIRKINPPHFKTSSEKFPSSSHALCASLVCRGPPVHPRASGTPQWTQPQWKSAPFSCFIIRYQKAQISPFCSQKRGFVHTLNHGGVSVLLGGSTSGLASLSTGDSGDSLLLPCFTKPSPFSHPVLMLSRTSLEILHRVPCRSGQGSCQ